MPVPDQPIPDQRTEAHIADVLESLDFVQWDRYINPVEGQYHIYGWIDREQDQYKDFVVLSFFGDYSWFITSSAKYSECIYKVVMQEDPTDHAGCIRVEDTFKVSNAIKSKRGQHANTKVEGRS